MIVCCLGFVALVLDLIMPNHRVKALMLQMRASQLRKSRLLKVSNIDFSNGNQEECDIIVIKNLDPLTDILEIKYELEELGYRVMGIRNAYNQSVGIALPIFFVKLRKNPKNASIYNLRYVAHQVVVIEAYKQCPDPPRCTCCQELYHTKEVCQNSPICAWCSGSHYTSICKRVNNSAPTCTRCSGRHPASYKGCVVYQRLLWKKENGGVIVNGPVARTCTAKICSEEKEKMSEESLQERKAIIFESKAYSLDKMRLEENKSNFWEHRRSSNEKKTASKEIKMNLQVRKTSQRKKKTSRERVENSHEKKIDSKNKKTSSQEREADLQPSSEEFDSKKWDDPPSSGDSSEEKLSLLEALIRNPETPVEEETNYQIQWTPPDEPPKSVENLKSELKDIMQHFLSMNELEKHALHRKEQMTWCLLFFHFSDSHIFSTCSIFSYHGSDCEDAHGY